MPPESIAAIDWESWTATEPATLVFVVDSGRVDGGEHVLLIRKKRGLGAGKVNAPGGRLEPGETALEAAVREVEEEVGVTPLAPREAGLLRFQFVDGYAIYVTVFRADGHLGEARETDEAVPLWTPVSEIPWDEMWADDRLWIPHLLAGRRFDGRFVFDGDAMLDHALAVEP